MSETNETVKISKSEFQEYMTFVLEFINESDRAAVVLCAAKLDNLLYHLLAKFLIPNTSSKDELFEPEAPLSTFNAKIQLSYRLGLIDAALARSLHLLRKIRNSFAHESTGCTLESGSHRDRAKELTAPFIEYDAFTRCKKLVFQDQKNISVDFRTAVSIMYMQIVVAYKKVSTLRIIKPVPLIPELWTKSNKAKNKKT